MKTNENFIEPLLIKAGSDNLSLGLLKSPPKNDCRVVSEDNYQLLKKALDTNSELLSALKTLNNEVEKSCSIGSDPRLLDLLNCWQVAYNAIGEGGQS